MIKCVKIAPFHVARRQQDNKHLLVNALVQALLTSPHINHVQRMHTPRTINSTVNHKE